MHLAAQDGADLTGQVAVLLAAGQMPPRLPLITGATAEDLACARPRLDPVLDTAPQTGARCRRSALTSGPPVLADPFWTAPDVRIESRCPQFNCSRADLGAFVHALSAASSDPHSAPWLSAADEAELLDAYGGDEVARPGGNRSRWWWAARHMGTDFTMACPARRVATWAASRGANSSAAYVYSFAHIPGGPSGAYPELAHHASEIPFVFRVAEAHGPNAESFHILPREAPLAHAMAAAWIALARDGTPGPSWPQWRVLGDGAVHQYAGAPWVRFDGEGGTVQPDEFKQRQCNVWDRVGLPPAVRGGMPLPHREWNP